MQSTYIGEQLNIDLRFYDAAGISVNVTEPKAVVYDPVRTAWLSGADLAQQDVGRYRLSVGSLPSTVMAGTHVVVGYGTYNGNRLYAVDRPLVQIHTAYERLQYCTLADYELHASCTLTATQREYIESLIRAASRWIDRECKTTFGVVRSYTDRFTTPAGNEDKFILSQYPVVAFTSVTPAGLSFYVNKESGLVQLPYTTTYVAASASYDYLTFAYTAGWAFVPDEVHVACLKLVDLVHHMGGHEGLGAESSLEYSMSIDPKPFAQIKEMVSAYKRIDAVSSEVLGGIG